MTSAAALLLLHEVNPIDHLLQPIQNPIESGTVSGKKDTHIRNGYPLLDLQSALRQPDIHKQLFLIEELCPTGVMAWILFISGLCRNVMNALYPKGATSIS